MSVSATDHLITTVKWLHHLTMRCSDLLPRPKCTFSFPACGARDLFRVEGYVLALAQRLQTVVQTAVTLSSSSALDSL